MLCYATLYVLIIFGPFFAVWDAVKHGLPCLIYDALVLDMPVQGAR